MVYTPSVRGQRIPVETEYAEAVGVRPFEAAFVGPAMALMQSGQELRDIERQLQRIRATAERAFAASRALDPRHAPLVSDIAATLREAQQAESRLQSTRALLEGSVGLTPSPAEAVPPTWPSPLLSMPVVRAAEAWAAAARELPREPPVEIRNTGKDLIVHVDLPGVRREDVEVQARDASLYVRAERSREEAEEEQVVSTERFANVFARKIWLPEPVVPGKASATFKDGVLEVTLPRKHPGEPAQRVNVK